MIVYCDTSALFKLYVQESGTNKVKEILARATSLSIAELGIIELYSALVRKAFQENIPLKQLESVLKSVETDWHAFSQVPWDESLIHESKKIIKKFLLRSYDAVHLASALLLAKNLGQPIGFLCFDKELNKAAKRCQTLRLL